MDAAILNAITSTSLQILIQDMLLPNVKKYTEAEAFEYLLW